MNAVMETRVNGVDTKGDAQRALNKTKTQAQAQRLLGCLLTLERKHGLEGVTAREIQQAYESQFRQRIDASTVAARLNVLRDRKLIYWGTQPRKCSVTGVSVMPNFSTPQQAVLFAGRAA